jgi:hypothetical protein
MPKTNRKLALFIQTILIVALMAMMGLVNWVELSIDFAALTTSSYWAKVVIKSVILILASTIGTNFTIEKAMETNEQLKKYYHEYTELLKLKDNLLFDEYMYNVYNRNIKKRKYLDWLRRLYYWNEMLGWTYSKELWANNSTEPKILKRKKRNRYCRSKTSLLVKMSDKWLEENIDRVWVWWWIPINPTAFSLTIGKSDMSETKVVSRESQARFGFLLSGVMTMVTISMFLASIFISADPAEAFATLQSTLQIIIQFMSDTFFVLFQFTRGMQFSKTIVEEEYVSVLFNRNRILQSYLKWAKDKPESPVSKILQIIESTQKEAQKNAPAAKS